MSRAPGETPAQWCTRATGEYVLAWAAFQVEWHRLSVVGWSVLAAGYPTLDDDYDGAMDSLEEADSERTDAVNELTRESVAAFRAAPRVKWRRGSKFGVYPNE